MSSPLVQGTLATAQQLQEAAATMDRSVITISLVTGALVGFLVLRGVLGLVADLVRVCQSALRFVGVLRCYVDASTQTDPIHWSGEVFTNPNSEVWHVGECRHVGYRAVPLRACAACSRSAINL